jgi:hypothetical protein
MHLAMFFILLIVMIVTTIAIYEALDRTIMTAWLIQIIDKNIFLAMLFNFGISSLIVLFTGEGTSSGAANLGASVLFPFYTYLKRKVAKVPYRFTYTPIMKFV